MVMVRKEDLRLGQRVRYHRKGGFVDALTQDSCGVLMDGGRYVIAKYDELSYEDEADRRQVQCR